MTLAESARDAASVLDAAGFAPDNSQQDAAVLARAILGWDAARWLTDRHSRLPPDFARRFAAAIARRAAHEPVAYITGEREFYGRTFAVSPAVLIPRPETELVIDQALAVLAESSATPHPDIVDVGTGSGCLAITLALACPSARLLAIDVSQAAIDVAAANADRHGVAARVEFRRGSLLDSLTMATDLIVSNPPYVAERDRASLPPDVRDYEPAEALFAGPDGLDVIRRLAPAAAQTLRSGGWLIIEIGAGQVEQVREIVGGASFGIRGVQDDLAGIPRVVVAQKIMSGTR